MRQPNKHDWTMMFIGDSCTVCWESIPNGAGKAEHAKAHVHQGKAIRIGSGTKSEPYRYIDLKQRPKCYASGESPMPGDCVEYVEQSTQPIPQSKEHGEIWIVTSVVGDMVCTKCDRAENWRQAHYTNSMNLISRKGVKT